MMTISEAIKILKSIAPPLDIETFRKTAKCYEALDIAIKALEQEPCEDAISRREAIKKFTYSWKGERIPDYDCDNFPTQIDIKTVKEILKELPSVTPQPKTGHWIDRFPTKECKCSVCDFLICISNGSYIDMVGQMKYCPNCGAKMIEPQSRK